MFFSVIMFVDRVFFLALHGPFLFALPFPTQKCDQPEQLRRFIKLFDSFANILDFNFVMVEEAKQYLCDTQISALALEIW